MDRGSSCEAERKRVPGNVLFEADRPECQLFAGDPAFDESPGGSSLVSGFHVRVARHPGTTRKLFSTMHKRLPTDHYRRRCGTVAASLPALCMPVELWHHSSDNMRVNRPGVFLDLNGTLVEPLKPERLDDLTLIRGVVEAIARLSAAGFVCPVVTVQSRIGKGLFSMADFQAWFATFAAGLKARDALVVGP
jgi:hypothetical protein